MAFFSRVPNTSFNAATPGLSQLAAAIVGGKQTYEAARDAEAKRQVDLRTGVAKMQQEQQTADLQSPDARVQRAMLSGDVPLSAQGDVRDYVNNGYIGKYQLPSDQPGPTMPAPAWATPDNMSAVAKQLAALSATAAGEAKGADDYAKGQQQQFETKIAKALYDGVVSPQQQAVGMSMLKASPIYHADEYGTTNNYTGAVDNSSAPAQEFAAKRQSDTLKNRADAGQATAAAARDYAVAAKTKAETAQLTSPDGGAGFISTTALDNAAARYNVDGTLPPLGLGKDGANIRRLVLNRAAELAAGTDPTVQRVNQLDAGAARSALGQLSKSQAMSAAFEQTANANANLALGLSKQNDRTGIPLLNAGLQAWRTGSGSPEATQFAAANETFVNEYAKIMSGGMGNGPVSDAARAKAHDLLTTSMTPAQYEGNVKLLQTEMTNRMKGFEDQAATLRSRIGGKPAQATPAGVPPQPGAAPQAAGTGMFRITHIDGQPQ